MVNMKLKAIYIDDEPELLEMFSELFSNEHIEIKTFSDTEKGLAAIAHENPHLVILDYRLKDTTGDKLAQKISSKIPKILISGDLSIHQDPHFIKIFRKPIEMSEMTEFLELQFKKLITLTS